ncbi:hypothetical protein [uncultured Tenacibaculum sp.]|uniref:hypothetical protein n=1 Tax=uncultured Tenacibaculum sp. TaxID=174713 RepID=UPI00263398AE|nr:hypothetical protein [uncultured Tenacibaculum sp.]
MKKILIIFIIALSNSIFSQNSVPDWISNALPVTEKHIKKAKKKRHKYLKKYKDSKEGTLEEKIYYRIKYIDYLKEILNLENKINTIKDGEKPFAYKIFVSGKGDSYLRNLKNKDHVIDIKRDTLLNLVDLLSNKRINKKTFYLPKEAKERNEAYDIIVDYDGENYLLQWSYDYSSIEEFPNFSKWRYKYLLYAERYNNEIREQEKFKITREKQNLDSSKLINKEKKKVKAEKVLCFNKVDDFTGEKITTTNQKKLIVVENKAVKARANQLWNEGIYVDYEMFVFAIKGVKKGKKLMFDVYSKHKTTKPLTYYGIMKKGKSISFKLKNGQIINLKLLNTTYPEINFRHKYSYYENTLALNSDDVLKLKKSPISKIRINYSKGYRDYNVNINDNSIIKILNCLD